MTLQQATTTKKMTRSRLPWPIRWLIKIIFTIFGLALAGLITAAIAITFLWPNLPDLTLLKNYQPNIPLRVYTADGFLIDEYGTERRKMTKLKDIPQIMRRALLVIEDDHFYEHSGVDFKGVARAVYMRLKEQSQQGASTITMQLARNFYLTNERKFTRKAYEALLSFKIEKELTKDEILEIYMNQIFLGQNAYGFAAAAQAYFGKPLSDITIAEAAMLAGLPKAPSAYNPIINPDRAKERQQHILKRLYEHKDITKEEYDAALQEKLVYKRTKETSNIHAEFVAEMARKLVHDIYGDEAYAKGLKIYTTINSKDQEAAYDSLRKGLMAYTNRHGYQGAEGKIELKDGKLTKDAESTLREEYPDSDDLVAAVVLTANPKHLVVAHDTKEEIEITGANLKVVANAIASKKIQRGSVIRITKQGKSGWTVSQMPGAEAGFVAINPKNGAIRALVGGFDFNRNKFNHVEQGKRQPGSSFKPFIYSAALMKGFTPGTIVNDAPIHFSSGETGGQSWDPKNSDGNYSGPIPLRTGLMKSKNIVSIRVLQKIGPEYAQEYAAKFGFDPKDHPAYLTMALGAGSVSMLQMAGGYAAFANGGYRVNPYLIEKITDEKGNVIHQALPAKAGDEKHRIIPAWNSFLMDYMMRGVTNGGTATKASVALKRQDIAGKTGTTNRAKDAWFAGYHNSVVGVAWVGFDEPKPLGAGETGGGVALPIWIGFMQHALKGVPVYTRPMPEGVTKVGSDYISDISREESVGSVGLEDGGNYKDTSTPDEDTETEMTQPTRPDLKSQKDLPENIKPSNPGSRQPAPIDNKDEPAAPPPPRPPSKPRQENSGNSTDYKPNKLQKNEN